MNLRTKLYIIVFHANTRPGRIFDLVLLWTILLSVFTVVIESIPTFDTKVYKIFNYIEWFFTILFSIEYICRIIISPKPLRYIFSFWGIVDFMASIPTYLSFAFTGAQFLLVVRLIRLLRVFRILKMAPFTSEAKVLTGALKQSLYKITLFLSAVLILVLLLGTLMYVVEGHQEGFSSIPQSIYWAIVTITTVGYGDLVPHTVIGKFVSSLIMITGYAIIAVPTGIVTVELGRSSRQEKTCGKCQQKNPSGSNFCSNCGEKLNKTLE